MKKIVNILNLSDLHFGYERAESKSSALVAERSNVLSKYFNKLSALDSDWKPDVVAITGDIRWNGSKEVYKEAHINKGMLKWQI